MVLDGSGWFWIILDGSGWFWMVLDGSGWFWMVLGGSWRSVVSEESADAAEQVRDHLADAVAGQAAAASVHAGRHGALLSPRMRQQDRRRGWRGLAPDISALVDLS
jgi:hypothetical protein